MEQQTEQQKKAIKPIKKNEGNGLFDKFWETYPKKSGKGYAKDCWNRISGVEEKLPKMLETINWQKQSEQWMRDNGQFIPMPSTWLNQERWDDQPVNNYPASLFEDENDE